MDNMTHDKRHVTTTCSPSTKDALQRAADTINDAREKAGTAGEWGRETISGLINSLVDRHLPGLVGQELDRAAQRLASDLEVVRGSADHLRQVGG